MGAVGRKGKETWKEIGVRGGKDTYTYGVYGVGGGKILSFCAQSKSTAPYCDDSFMLFHFCLSPRNRHRIPSVANMCFDPGLLGFNLILCCVYLVTLS